MCADGGANRLYDRVDWIPDLIVGDLDSLRPSVRKHYAAQGTRILERPDQNFNDLDKALQAAMAEECTHCIVFGAFGGRFDQEMASMQALYKWSQEEKLQSLWMYDDHTCACLLPAHVENRIELHLVESGQVGEGRTCGLIPLGGPCQSVTTTGFQWNLTDQPTEFGGLVSTSNRIIGPQVTVRASSPLIFTAEIHSGETNSWSLPSHHWEDKKEKASK